MSNHHAVKAAQTYLALRLGMVLLVALLFASVAFQFFSADCLQLSISAYYYTAARPVFVGALCAVGACLIIYRGNTDTENVLLDFAGFLAFVVAFVPTTIDRTCDPSNVPSPDEIASAIENNLWMLLLSGFAATGVGWWLRRRKGLKEPLNRYARWSLVVSVAALATGTIFFAVRPEELRRLGHSVAAVALFAFFIAVVFVNAWGFAEERGRGTVRSAIKNRYAIVAWAMVITLLGLLLTGRLVEGFRHWLFVLEAALITEFAVFWGIQTGELGGKVAR